MKIVKTKEFRRNLAEYLDQATIESIYIERPGGNSCRYDQSPKKTSNSSNIVITTELRHLQLKLLCCPLGKNMPMAEMIRSLKTQKHNITSARLPRQRNETFPNSLFPPIQDPHIPRTVFILR